MDFINQQVYNNGSYINLQIPKFCPQCGAVNNPETIILSKQNIKTSDKNELVISASHHCNACNKSHFTIQVESTGGSYLAKSVYPETQPSLLPEEIYELSPRFVKIYGDSEAAEQRGATELAGTGYRSALEILIKDYALKYSEDGKDTISKLNLANAIGKYFKGEFFSAAEVVRLLGNDYTHWEKKYDFKLEQLKAYLNVFIDHVKVQIMLKEPIVSTKKN
ncbi:MAG: hypothetical protein SOH50_05785 [Leuconostoc mesenteroides]|uniref:hypothetical protein n=1 Tax=Leuconostoc mesenteroides TaxID=1245 RepID=UPI002F396463